MATQFNTPCELHPAIAYNNFSRFTKTKHTEIMNTEEFKKNYRLIVEKLFNNWQNLRLAVEHGMGGRNGQKVSCIRYKTASLYLIAFSP